MAKKADKDDGGSGPGASGRPRPRASQPAADKDEADLGSALRSIYQQTVEEVIPPEMLDLLKRLD